MLKRLGKERLEALDIRAQLPSWNKLKVYESSFIPAFESRLEELKEKRMEGKIK